MSTALNISNLEFRYQQEANPVLRISQVQVQRGHSVFIHGPSGSGKTTLLGLITGILTSPESQIQVLGTNLSSLSTAERDAWRGDHVGYIFQMFNLIPYLSLLENVMLPLLLSERRRAHSKDAAVEAKNLIHQLGLSSHSSTLVTRLSVGQQQRVAVARALMGRPELIVADEPTSALDTDHRDTFVRLLLAQARQTGATVLFVSHDQSLSKLFDREISLPKINEAIL